MPRVLNANRDDCSNAVFVGRPSPFGNPYVIGVHGSRKQVIELYKKWVLAQPNLVKMVKEELRGKNLYCYCSPKPCHGDFLLWLANQTSLFEEI